MIQEIRLRNFQSHKDTRLLMHNGVNAIVGLSDSGKTAIFRAINWVINNKPSGDEFQSHWGGETIVDITLSEGIVITRGRDKKGNYYKHSSIPDEFRAFGAGAPPKEIQDAFNMTEVNLMPQMDAPFLLSADAGKVAQTLNKVVNLDVIDTAISNIRKQKGEVDRQHKSLKEQLDLLVKQEKSFDYLDVVEKVVQKYEEIKQDRQKVVQNIQALRTLTSRLKRNQDDIMANRRLARASGLLEKAGELLEVLTKTRKQRQSLSRIGGEMSELARTIADASALIPASSLVSTAEELNTKLNASRKARTRLRSLVREIMMAETKQGIAEEDLADLEKQFHDQMPAVCPLCNQEVNHEG